MAQLITLDTSGVVAAMNRDDPDHERVRDVLEGDLGPLLLPAGIMAEVTYMVERRLGVRAVDALLEDVAEGGYSLECGDRDIPRIRELMEQYRDLRLGYSDAAVAACAERNGGKVLTLDLRDFGVLARAGLVTIAPG